MSRLSADDVRELAGIDSRVLERLLEPRRGSLGGVFLLLRTTDELMELSRQVGSLCFSTSIKSRMTETCARARARDKALSLQVQQLEHFEHVGDFRRAYPRSKDLATRCRGRLSGNVEAKDSIRPENFGNAANSIATQFSRLDPQPNRTILRV